MAIDKTSLPERVVAALGPEAAADLLEWLDDRLQQAEQPAEARFSAIVARQKVNVLMLEQVSNLLLAGTPALIEAESGRLCWRVPVDLTLPGKGRVAQIGTIDVDAQYGYTTFDEATQRLFEQRCEYLYQTEHSPSPIPDSTRAA